MNFDPSRWTEASAKLRAEAIVQRGGPRVLTHCIGFIDGTVRKISQPAGNDDHRGGVSVHQLKRACFNGHKWCVQQSTQQSNNSSTASCAGRTVSSFSRWSPRVVLLKRYTVHEIRFVVDQVCQGPIEGRHHDMWLLADSGWSTKFQHMKWSGTQFFLYADKGGVDSHHHQQ